jgi:hypothetical protein
MSLSRGPAPNRPQEGEILVADGFKVVTAALSPPSVGQRLGESDDITRPPTEAATEPQHNQAKPGSVALSDACRPPTMACHPTPPIWRRSGRR